MEVLCFMADKERQSYIDEINRLNQLVSTLTETLNNQSSTINELTAEISLEIIKRQIEQSRKELEKNAGMPFITWGVLVFVTTLSVQYLGIICLPYSLLYGAFMVQKAY